MATQPRVFVCHSHNDETFTAQLVSDLRAAGADVWFDEPALSTATWLQQAQGAMGRSDWFVLVLTPDSLRSPWVGADVDLAFHLVSQNRMKGIIPFVARPFDAKDLPPHWATLQRYDSVSDYPAALARLLRAIGLSAATVHIPSRPDVPGKQATLKSTNIFISYKSSDRPAVTEVAERLAAESHKVWFDQQLEGGQIWWNEILKNIRATELFIFALTPTSLNSIPCQREYSYADALRKRVLPLILVDGVNMQLLPPALQQIQAVDYRNPGAAGWPNLSRALANLPPARPAPHPLPAEPPVPISPLGALKAQIDGIATLSKLDQLDILYELKTQLRRADAAAAARQLLVSFLERPDLLYLVGEEAHQELAKVSR